MNIEPIIPSQNSDKDVVKSRSIKKTKYRYCLVDYRDKRHRTDVLLSQTDCNIDILPDGIMVIGNFVTNTRVISIMKNEIESLTLVRGKEVVDTFYLSPMHMLSKLGVPNHISRYASILPSEYKISEAQIIIKCKEYQISLITDGERFEKVLRSFKHAGYGKQLRILKKPSSIPSFA